ncbi:hypothetical protein AB0C59_02045 [Streptomyces sp. NPDC048664]|uniref:hypothetical protein n=1 Tax=Streptomyces sp. NPDC048664 TaxID=3154505 RepID=UPI003413E1F5
MSPIRVVTGAVLAAAGALLLAGCGNPGGPVGAGATRTAVAPVQLWPGGLPTISVPPIGYGERDTRTVPGVKAPDGDVHALNPAVVVRADVSTEPAKGPRTDGLAAATVDKLIACVPKPSTCPIMKPYYSDLTGDGKDELIVGISMPDRQTSVRVYMPEKGGLTRILQDAEPFIGVSLARGDLITRSLSAGIPGYEYRTAWSWDDRQRAMLPTRDEIIRIKPTGSSSPEVPTETP